MKSPNALIAKDHGTHYDLTPTGVLMMAADAMQDETTAQSGRRNAKKLLDDMLRAAVAGGYTQADILRTLLSQRPVDTRRVVTMAQQACNQAGNERLRPIFEAAKLVGKK